MSNLGVRLTGKLGGSCGDHAVRTAAAVARAALSLAGMPAGAAGGGAFSSCLGSGADLWPQAPITEVFVALT